MFLDDDDISSPNRGGGPPIFDFYDPAELFSDTILQTSEVDSPCYEEHSSYAKSNNNISQEEVDNLHNNYQDRTGNTTTSTTTSSSSNLSLIFDSTDEINKASIDFSSSHFSPLLHPFLTGQQQNDLSLSHQHQMPLTDAVINAITEYSASEHLPTLMGPCVFEQDCLSSFMPLNPSCSLLAPSFITTTLSTHSPGLLFSVSGHQQQLDFQGDRFFCPTPLQQHIFNHADLQALSSESEQLVNGSTPLASEMTSLEDSGFNNKVGKLSVEQRKEKISRYMKKRNERNFSKKIKYACRKTLADSRPRVRGRFAKNDDFGETTRTASSNHEDDDEEEEEVCVKEEEDMVDSGADIFAHISGVNSFNCNYPIQSWI